ncbi:MAG: ABC transporter ATP-binding protein [Armatimonadota bacterium]|nr:ABC transporter ATP-binding protein [Armatimonadota bacterium]MDR7427531.1 ABC transporter ATP-binding protein [Armatimonadota bacterium]MDR7463459.1 ABC transporter ATP-binding protein [Armatimonadota bacterium]MDR7469695.1 ABC transporter ATP-binding protein [Armatimonadota bacterium]MDR7473972.1 ABC transporter ATP-binding protein [Armatimonadota bacterium]
MILQGLRLRRYYPWGHSLLGPRQWVRAVEEVTIGVRAGETVALVGESGSGKTTTGRLLLGLEPPTAGQVVFRGLPLGALAGPARQAFRRAVQPVFQDSTASLNPRKTVAHTVGLGLAAAGVSPADRRRELMRLLEEVGLEPAAAFLDRFPHQLSGGQRQRVNIARALATSPEVIVADEPVSALDLSVRAQILLLLLRLQRERRLAYLFISHDLAVVRSIAHRAAVMYLGRIVEEGPTEEVFRRPSHPYTEALISATPVPDPRTKRERIILAGDVPSPLRPPPGCPFHPRCPVAADICRRVFPPVVELGAGHSAVCHFARERAATFAGSQG